jgi:hypothetical protein
VGFESEMDDDDDDSLGIQNWGFYDTVKGNLGL